MQLRALLLALVLAGSGASAAAAQSLSPMHGAGPTPSDTKGFRLLVGNPYPGSMVFVILALDPKFRLPADHVVVQPAEIRLGAGLSRSVLVAFRLAPGQKERTIGVCVQPKAIEGTVLPRVCGTYTGTRAGSGAGL